MRCSALREGGADESIVNAADPAIGNGDTEFAMKFCAIDGDQVADPVRAPGCNDRRNSLNPRRSNRVGPGCARRPVGGQNFIADHIPFPMGVESGGIGCQIHPRFALTQRALRIFFLIDNDRQKHEWGGRDQKEHL